ncbi:MAG: S8 family serine peptidase [Pseudomonadota bacterium]
MNASAPALPLAVEGDLIKGEDLQQSLHHLTALAGQLEELAGDNRTVPEQRRLARHRRSLLGLADCLRALSVPLAAGQPRVQAPHIDAAVAYAVQAIGQGGPLRVLLAKVDLLLDFFATVLGGDGGQMVRAAEHLKQCLCDVADIACGTAWSAPAPDALHRSWEAAPYVLLPIRGLRSPEMAALRAPLASPSTLAAAGGAALRTLASHAGADAAAPLVLHSVHEDGAKLAELTGREILALKVSDPGVRVMPLVLYQVNRRALLRVEHAAAPAVATAKRALKVKVVQAGSKTPVAGARVIAFTDFIGRAGAEAVSGADGGAVLALGGARKKLEVLVVYGPSGYWGLYQQDATLKNNARLAIEAIDLGAPDYLSLLYGDKPFEAGAGVTVGVIDTGVELTHPDLVVAGGAAFVVDEDDAGGPGPAATEGEHGSHVAGIVAARGQAPAGRRGVAPGVRLMSYRVFPNGGGGASNYDIIRAIDRGVSDGCDLLNLSLGGPTRDEAVREAIKSAFDHGTVCIVATGNDSRSPVSYPARWPEAVAVSAVGKIGTYPLGSTETMDALAPFSPDDASVFVAGFSNVGPEVDLTGPGVGIVSTVPGGAYAVMSGTSMACPAVTGAAAALLGQHPAVLAMPRDSVRAIAMLKVINGAAATLKFARQDEGLGLLS